MQKNFKTPLTPHPPLPHVSDRNSGTPLDVSLTNSHPCAFDTQTPLAGFVRFEERRGKQTSSTVLIRLKVSSLVLVISLIIFRTQMTTYQAFISGIFHAPRVSMLPSSVSIGNRIEEGTCLGIRIPEKCPSIQTNLENSIIISTRPRRSFVSGIPFNLPCFHRVDQRRTDVEN